MRIAICDDCKEDRSKIHAIIKECFGRESYEINEHENGKELLEKAGIYDVIILDIEMPEIDGLTVKEALQWNKKDIVIIFVSSHEEMMADAYGLNVYGFVTKEKIQFQLPKILGKLQQAWRPHVMLEEGIDSREIEYISAENVYTMCHLANGDTKLLRVSLNDMEKKLKECDFFRIHRGYLINLKYVKQVKQKVIMNDSSEISVAIRKQKKFMDAYDEFCKKNARFS